MGLYNHQTLQTSVLRLKAAARDATAPPDVWENAHDDRIEIHFKVRPGPFFLQALRATQALDEPQKWRWHFQGHFWYARRNEATRKFAVALLAQANVEKPLIRPLPWEECEAFPVSEWEEARIKGDTSLNYEMWVEEKIAVATE